ncbi:MAG: c-type cytochrome, partial [Myxococcales bacterium]|nr:c-type cytochrome [Myxococcales bacterium]
VTKRGEKAFEDIGCATCHVPALKGPRGLIPAYSDLLLHDMGPELADGIRMKLATGAEFRTQPLWGIVAVGPYLHDGRADTLDEAIRWHGGEGEGARDRYIALPPADKYALIAFLGSLGGADEASPGLLPPGAKAPGVGELGGPIRELTAAEQDQFDMGREVFDRDTFMSDGLGPVFNGDACRSCHFDPVIGGSGPVDVNVIRHGEVVDGTTFIAPPFGTISQRHATDGSTRPPFFEDANVTEQRQTPALFGLGLIDRVPAADIIAREDVDDADGDGISGCAQILPDGRLGRLGWKAQVPSVAEFSRDAGLAELGLTLPAQAGLTFGATHDDDDSPDPEMSLPDLTAMNFFLSNLAPPPREHHDLAKEERGEAVFGEVGCDACHVPTLKTADGVAVHAYTDVLLHDVSNGAWGIVDGLAGMGDFRTPPLWGLRLTGPYMHDGRATTIDDAIMAHAGEAETSRMRYEGLSDADRDAILAFLKSL